jgi:hypothetical protein
MARNFNIWPPNNPRAVIRLGLGVLVAANLVAAYFVVRPLGGSAEELSQQALDMHSQIRQQQGALKATSSWATIFCRAVRLIPSSWES